MGSQFVDFNADGHIDYVSATFDGSPHVAYGSPKGFQKPVRLKDKSGQRVIICSIWDYDKRKHIDLGRSYADGESRGERCISALAFDWDGDGDYDLLLGSYENGTLYRQMNEGSNAKPAFTGKNIPVLAGGKPFALPSKMTTPRLVDWDGDGDMDLIAGSFGVGYGPKQQSGAVYFARNVGKKGAPVFGKIETLIAPSHGAPDAPTHPVEGLYADAVDYDGDGDLDLVVGGYAKWTPKARNLDQDEQAKLAKLRTEMDALNKLRSALTRKMSLEAGEEIQAKRLTGEAANEVHRKVYTKYRKENSAHAKSHAKLKKQLDKLVPSKQRKSFVWLYERI